MHFKLLILLVSSLLLFPLQTSFAGSLHADAAVYSDYVWRGLTQTNGRPAVQGGLEFVTDGTWYFGAWVSNTTMGTNGQNSPELDYYVGMSNKGKGMAYDLGMINYTFPESSGDDFTEIYFSFILDSYSVKYSTSADVGTYIEFNMTQKLHLRKDTYLNFHVGQYQINSGTDYIDGNVAIIVSEFSLTISQTTLNSTHDKDTKYFVGWNRTF